MPVLTAFALLSCATGAPAVNSHSPKSPADGTTVPSGDGTAPVAPARATPSPLYKSFFFAHELGGQLYVQLSNDPAEAAALRRQAGAPLLAGIGGAAGDVASADDPAPELLEGDYRYVLSLPVGDPETDGAFPASALPAQWEVYSGAQLVCRASVGPMKDISISVPHFGQVEGWNTDPDSGPAKNADTRRELFGQGAQHVMFQVKDCKMAPGQQLIAETLWARPDSAFKPLITDFFHQAPAGVADELVGRSREMLVWTLLAAKVKKAYALDPSQPAEIPAEERVAYGVIVHNPAVTQEVATIRLGMGETECGHGPAEAYLTHVWSRTGNAPWTLLMAHPEDPDTGVVGLEPLLWGDFNGDGVLDAVFKTGPFREERTLFQLDSTGLGSPIKRTYLNFNDCPC